MPLHGVLETGFHAGRMPTKIIFKNSPQLWKNTRAGSKRQFKERRQLNRAKRKEGGSSGRGKGRQQWKVEYTRGPEPKTILEANYCTPGGREGRRCTGEPFNRLTETCISIYIARF